MIDTDSLLLIMLGLIVGNLLAIGYNTAKTEFTHKCLKRLENKVTQIFNKVFDIHE